MTRNLPNGTDANAPPIQLSFTLPQSPQVRIQLRLTNLKTSLLLFLTTSSAESSSSSCALGSFVYAIPNRSNPAAPLSTPLYTQANTLDFATRLAKILARKAEKPVYVGNSMSFAAAGRGGDVEEEMEGFRMVVAVVMDELKKAEENDEDESEEEESEESSMEDSSEED